MRSMAASIQGRCGIAGMILLVANALLFCQLSWHADSRSVEHRSQVVNLGNGLVKLSNTRINVKWQIQKHSSRRVICTSSGSKRRAGTKTYAVRRKRVFEPGQGVVIRGLTNSTKFNGKTGVVKDTTEKGILVELPSHPKPLLVPSSKLRKCQRWLDPKTHEASNPNNTYPPPPDVIDVVYSAVLLIPGLHTPPLPAKPNTPNVPPERFWVSQIPKEENGGSVDIFFSGYNKLTLHGQAQCGQLGVEMRSRFVDDLELLPEDILASSSSSSSPIEVKVPPGALETSSAKAFLSGLLDLDMDATTTTTADYDHDHEANDDDGAAGGVGLQTRKEQEARGSSGVDLSKLIRIESPIRGFKMPTGDDSPRLEQLLVQFDNGALPEQPSLANLVATRIKPAALSRRRREEKPEKKLVRTPTFNHKTDGNATIESGIGADVWNNVLAEIRAHFLYGLPFPWNLNDDAIETMHRHRLNMTRKALTNDEYRRIVAGPMLHTLIEEIGDVLFYGLERNLTVYVIDEGVMHALVASFSRKLRSGWPAPCSHLVLEIGKDKRQTAENQARERHVARIMFNNQEFALGEGSAWIPFTDLIGRISQSVLQPEEQAEAFAYRTHPATTGEDISQDSMTMKAMTPREGGGALQKNFGEDAEDGYKGTEEILNDDLHKWLDDAGVPHLYQKFRSAGVSSVSQARKAVLQDIRNFSEEISLEIGERLKLLQFASREQEDEERRRRRKEDAEGEE